MIKNENAVSEVIGMVLVLSISTVVIGSILLIGMPLIESGEHKAKVDVVANSFLSFQNDIEEVVRGPIWIRDPIGTTKIDKLGPSRETEFELMEGILSVYPNITNITYSVFGVNDSNNYNISIPSSSVIYNKDNDAIIYENGAIIRKYETGKPLMISEPLITMYDAGVGDNISISIHAITINGTLSSVGGDGRAWAEIRPQSYKQNIEPTGSPNSNQTTIKIYSKYPDVWSNFFDTRLKETGLIKSIKENITGYNISGKYPLEVQIYGNVNNRTIPDIFLSIYESRLDIKVR